LQVFWGNPRLLLCLRHRFFDGIAYQPVVPFKVERLLGPNKGPDGQFNLFTAVLAYIFFGDMEVFPSVFACPDIFMADITL
jgi:hypothetical protein